MNGSYDGLNFLGVFERISAPVGVTPYRKVALSEVFVVKESFFAGAMVGARLGTSRRFLSSVVAAALTLSGCDDATRAQALDATVPGKATIAPCLDCLELIRVDVQRPPRGEGEGDPDDIDPRAVLYFAYVPDDPGGEPDAGGPACPRERLGVLPELHVGLRVGDDEFWSISREVVPVVDGGQTTYPIEINAPDVPIDVLQGLPPGNVMLVGACNGLDNDCDGRADESVEEAQIPVVCGRGPCRALGIRTCEDGVPGTQCEPLPAEAEVCDGRDNDCDGLTDEELLNACGACGPTPVERCDGIDQDCDGAIDECYSGPPETQGVGICAAGRLECGPGGQDVRCVDERLTEVEHPNSRGPRSLDDDCDGEEDEPSFGCASCGPDSPSHPVLDAQVGRAERYVLRIQLPSPVPEDPAERQRIIEALQSRIIDDLRDALGPDDALFAVIHRFRDIFALIVEADRPALEALVGHRDVKTAFRDLRLETALMDAAADVGWPLTHRMSAITGKNVELTLEPFVKTRRRRSIHPARSLVLVRKRPRGAPTRCSARLTASSRCSRRSTSSRPPSASG